MSTHPAQSLGAAFGAVAEQGREQRAVMAWALASFFAAGTVLALVSLAFSDYIEGANRTADLITCVVALALAALIGLGWRQLPGWAFHVLLAIGTVIASAGTYFVTGLAGDTEMFYLWVVLYASYFFTRVQALVQLAFLGLCYATVLAIGPAVGNVGARWLITIGTLLVTSLLVGALRDMLNRRIEERQRSQRQLEESLSVLEATLESTADGILVVDREGGIVSLNGKFLEMWRIPNHVIESRDDDAAIAFVVDQLADPDQFRRKIRELYDRPEAESYDVLKFKDGRVFERYSQPQRGSDGEVYGRVWSFRDVTERERIQSQLRHLADYDALTGLLNRRRFEEELSRQVAYAGRYGSAGAVLVLDLDDFKYVNDMLGHHAGDALIRSVANLLRDRMRKSDTIARLGGDEFAILLPRADPEGACLVAENLLETIRRHRAVFRGQRVRITTSIGIAVISGTAAGSGEELLGQADSAMYEAKEAGRDRVSMYSHPEEPTAAVSIGVSWPERIRRAVDENLFALYAQPILDLASNEISQYELLLRAIGDRGEVIPPTAFLPAAERFGLVREIDAWVTRRAIRLIEAHRHAGRELRLEVNLSGRTIGDASLPRMIESELEGTGIDPSSLIFEVTETAAISNMEEAREFASALTALGCQFALDDFGAGFGSFYYLKYLPLDYLKIDGDFIANLARSDTDQSVVRAIVDLSRSLGKRTIAEFVANPETVSLLREYGVDYAQGFFVGHPQPVSEMWADVRAAGTLGSSPRRAR